MTRLDRRGRCAPLALLVAAGLAGCVVAPARRDLPVDATPPAAWASDGAGHLDLDAEPTRGDLSWLDGFGSPELEAVVRRALESNPELRAAEARLAQALAAARIEHAALKPAVEAGLSAARRRQNFVGLPIPGTTGVLSTTSTTTGLDLGASWEADLWGRIRAGARASLADVQANDADWRAARLSLGGAAAKAWFSWIESERQLELAAAQLDTLRDSEDRVRTRYERGLRPSIDYRLARATRADAEARVELRRIQRDGARRALERLLGEYPDGLGSTPPEFPRLAAGVPGGLPASLISRRPDLVAAERRLAAADQRELAARRALYPRLGLTASGGTASDALSDLLDGDFRVWSLFAGLTQPLFQGGRLRAGVDASVAGVDAARLEFAGVALDAWLEVETALDLEGDLAARERALDEAARESVAARDLADRRYREGVGDYLTVLQSQAQALASESAALSMRRARLANRVDLLLALGGGFRAPASPESEDLESLAGRGIGDAETER